MGNIGVFDETQEDFESYAIRIEQYFKANKVEDDLKAASFLAIMGAKCFRLLKNLVSPKLPGSCTYKELKDALEKHFKPKNLVIYERYKFYNCHQGESESIQDYVANIRELATTCNFKTHLAEMMRDKFVMGLRDQKTLKALLTKEDTLTLDEAIDFAVAHEAAEKDAKVMVSVGGAINKTNSNTNYVKTHKKKAPVNDNKTILSLNLIQFLIPLAMGVVQITGNRTVLLRMPCAINVKE